MLGAFLTPGNLNLTILSSTAVPPIKVNFAVKVYPTMVHTTAISLVTGVQAAVGEGGVMVGGKVKTS